MLLEAYVLVCCVPFIFRLLFCGRVIMAASFGGNSSSCCVRACEVPIGVVHCVPDAKEVLLLCVRFPKGMPCVFVVCVN